MNERLLGPSDSNEPIDITLVVDAAAWGAMVRRTRAVSEMRDFGLVEAEVPPRPLTDEQRAAALAADIAAISGLNVLTLDYGYSYRPQYPGTH